MKNQLVGLAKEAASPSFVILSWVAPLRSLAHIVTFIDPLNQNLFKEYPGAIPNYQGVRHTLPGKNTEEVYLHASDFQFFKGKPSGEMISHNL